MDKTSEPLVDFVTEDLDPKVVNQETWNNLNKISTYTHRLFSYRYKLLIYKLIPLALHIYFNRSLNAK